MRLPQFHNSRPRGVSTSVLALALLTSLAACGPTTQQSQISSSNASGGSSSGLNIKLDVDRYEFKTPSAMCPATLVAEIVVGGHGQSHWNTPDGQRPANATKAVVLQQGYRIYTPVTFSKSRTLLDHRHNPTHEFVTLGGQIGPDQYQVDDFPQVVSGNRYLVVFAPGSQPAGLGKTEDWLVAYNAFPIDSQNMVELQHAGSASEKGLGTPQPEVKIQLTQLEQQLATCR